MKVLKYKLLISEGLIASIHGMNYYIDEYRIPEINLTFNFHEDKLTIFTYDRSKDGRELTTLELDISSSLIDRISNIFDDEKRIELRRKELYTDLKDIIGK